MKFFKIIALWVFAFMATVAFGEWSASVGLEWVAKILVAFLYGHFIMLMTAFLIATVADKGINTSVWWAVVVHVAICTIVLERDLLFMIGPFLGIALSYWLLRKSGEILARQPTVAA